MFKLFIYLLSMYFMFGVVLEKRNLNIFKIYGLFCLVYVLESRIDIQMILNLLVQYINREGDSMLWEFKREKDQLRQGEFVREIFWCIGKLEMKLEVQLIIGKGSRWLQIKKVV